MHVLAQRWPGLAELPYAEIAELPTPIDSLVLVEGSPFARLDADGESPLPLRSLLVKRDDLTSAVYGGNKVRKLEFLLGDALERGAKSVITFGAYGSNHALATAVHAPRFGLEAHVILSPQAPSRFAPATLLAHAGVGSQVHVAEDWYAAYDMAERLAVELAERDGVEPYSFPAGGSSPMGAVGYVNAAVEILSQATAAGVDPNAGAAGGFALPDVVYVAAGTLGTAVGLALGFAAASSPTRVMAFRVTPPSVANLEVAEGLCAETVALLRDYDPSFPDIRFEDLPLELREDQYGEDYAVPTDGAREAVAVAGDAGLSLETTYTGKAMSGLFADARAGFLRDEGVLFLDTYSSAPKPAPGDASLLPVVLQEYIRECDAL